MVKVQVGLGVLSLPATLHTLGIVPGVILMLVICAMNSCESVLGLKLDQD
jgi:amino acid permease